MRRDRRRSGGGFKKFLVLLFLMIIVSGVVYIYTSSQFERQSPKIFIDDGIFWNLQDPIDIKFSDNVGVKNVKVTITDGKNAMVLANEELANPLAKFSLSVNMKNRSFFKESSKLFLKIEAKDASKWNFLSGNEANKIVEIKLDIKKPQLSIINNSYSIVKGGVGFVVFKADDENLDEVFIQINNGDKFAVAPFYKNGYYATLVPWEYNNENFFAYAIAKDKAGNESKERVRFYYVNRKYRTSNIKVSDNFINGKISDLAFKYAQEPDKMSKGEKFKFINETFRNSNEVVINNVASKLKNDLIKDFSILPFYPLKNAAAVASFGDHRYYKYEDKTISESYHLGLDLASVMMADIVSSNDGVVVFAGENGIYGNNIVISHGFGLYSLYGHCSKLKIRVGDKIKKGDIIAQTGTTGLALGDHLHFSMIVQGKYVRPEEWMDAKWFLDNVSSVMQDAKKAIDNR